MMIMPKPTTFQTTETMTAKRPMFALVEPEHRLVEHADVDQHLVEQPDLLVEQPDPEQARAREADDDRQEDDAAGQPHDRPVDGGEEREQEAEADQDRRDPERVADGEPERLPERAVA